MMTPAEEQHLESRERVIASLKEQLRESKVSLDSAMDSLRRQREASAGSLWFWQDDGQDNPESITCQVVVKPDRFRQLLAAESRLHTLTRATPENWGNEDMSAAPEGEMLRLYVRFNEHPTEDIPTGACAATIGFKDAAGWHIAGWCWHHDHFTEGKGTPVAWLPMLSTTPEHRSPIFEVMP